MLIGTSKTIITPALERPVYLAGFGQNRRAVDIHDDLYACALALSDGQATLVCCALDLIGFFRPHVLDVVRRVNTKLPGVQVLLASVHPHHGPDTMGLWGPDDKTPGVDPEYLEATKNKMVATIQAAVANLQPAFHQKAVSIHVPGLAKNARNPEIVDDELTLLQFLDGNGQPLASLFNFPCHPEVLWEHNTHITADYPGVLRRQVESLTGAPCIFFSGALGGMMTPDVKDHSFEEAEAMGCRLAEAGVQALAAAESQPFAAFSLRSTEVKVKLTNILFKIAFRRKLLPDVRDQQGVISTQVSLVKLGDLWFAAVPGELLPKLGLGLKAELVRRGARVAGILGLSDDELGYILPEEDYHYPLLFLKPGKHYEETMSVSKKIGPAVVAGIQRLF
jgi:hypothetical protein